MKNKRQSYIGRLHNRLLSLDQGFSLLELIITLVIAAIVGVVMVQFMRSQVLDSVDPVLLLQQDYRAIQGMENIKAVYRSQLESGTFDFTTFQANLQTYANDASLNVVGKDISFDADGVESATPSNSLLKVTVSDADLQVVSIFSD